MRLDGKVALITGGGEGIGEAVARLFAEVGAAVVITGRRKDVVERVAGEIVQAGGKALSVAGSVTDETHVRSAVSEAVHAFGKLQILVNNAGIIGKRKKSFPEGDIEEIREILETNYFGPMQMNAQFLELLNTVFTFVPKRVI